MGAAIMFVGAIIVAASVFFYFRAASRAKAARSWPAVPGRIVSSTVTHTVETDMDNDSEDVWTVAVTYAYTAGGLERQGQRIGWGVSNRWTVEKKAQALAARYPEGAAVKVYVDPADPEQSVLETGRPDPAKSIIFGVVGLILLFVGMSLMG